MTSLPSRKPASLDPESQYDLFVHGNGGTVDLNTLDLPPNPQELDRPVTHCGVVGVLNHPEASVMAYYALHSLQHRGQEAAGILAAKTDTNGQAGKRRFTIHKDHGLVLKVFEDSKILTQHLAGDTAIAHNRYSTTGATGKLENVQPFYMHYKHGHFGLAHNGNLTNTREIRERLQDVGTIFQTTTDSELILHLIARSRQTEQIEQIREALQQVRGAYSLVMMTDTMLIAARDPNGFRPLSLGRIKRKDGQWAYIVASETCAFDIVGGEYIRDVYPNEIIIIDYRTTETGEVISTFIDAVAPKPSYCIFEYIYFSRPDSKIFEENVDKVRRKLGKNLAHESPVSPEPGEKVTVINVPDSSNTATLGYAGENEKAGGPTKYQIGLIRSHYVGRTFIQPGQDNREMKVKVKFNTVKGVLENKRVVVVDDSIVRGTTSKSLVNLIREAKPAEVHLRITSPPITHPCKYGMDFPSRGELIANEHEMDEVKIGKALGVDSLRYLSIEKLLDSVPSCNKRGDEIGYCTACFTGNYPVPIDEVAEAQIANND
ncbi:MAG TPA: amidophosphoribosyltransferase [Candidatus Kapabacteria bacterium]|nr:amidophosphoribosyltransferase [Candidatus Kapabacteria bacterium]